MDNIRHTFVSGLRFQTGVQYRVKDIEGLVWQKLPTTSPRMRTENTGAALCLTQCIALQNQMTRRTAVVLLRRLRRIPYLGTLDATGVKQAIRAYGLNVPVQSFLVDGPAMCGSLTRAAIETGGACMVRFASGRDIYWSLVAGVETMGTETCALLLLDTDSYEAWACGHNMRIELQRDTRRHKEAEAEEPFVCRGLTGTASLVRPLELLVFPKLQ